MPIIGTDVIRQIITTKPIRNGSAVCGVDKQGNIQVIAPILNHAPVPSGVEAKWTERFIDNLGR